MSKFTDYGGMKLQLPNKSPPPSMQHVVFQIEKQMSPVIRCCLSALHRLFWDTSKFFSIAHVGHDVFQVRGHCFAGPLGEAGICSFRDHY